MAVCHCSTPMDSTPHTPTGASSTPAAPSASLTNRLFRAAVATAALSAALAFGVLYAVLSTDVREDARLRLEADARWLVDQVQRAGPDLPAHLAGLWDQRPEFATGGDHFALVWDTTQGRLSGASASLPAPAPGVDHAPAPLQQPRHAEVPLADGTPVQWAWLRARSGSLQAAEFDVAVGHDQRSLAGSLRRLALACLVGALLVAVLSGAMASWWLPRLLRPLRELGRVATGEAAEADAGSTSAVRELHPIARRLRQLTQRVDSLQRRERRFLDDAAYELRAPLAQMHAIADVALQQPQDGRRATSALSDVKQLTRRMAALVELLFRLARHGRGVELEERVVGMAELVGAALTQSREAMADRGITWACDSEPQAEVRTDPGLATALLDHLIGHLLDLARPGSQMRLHWRGLDAPCIDLSVQLKDESLTDPVREHMHCGLEIAQLVGQALGARVDAALRGQLWNVRVDFARHRQAEPPAVEYGPSALGELAA